MVAKFIYVVVIIKRATNVKIELVPERLSFKIQNSHINSGRKDNALELHFLV